MWECWYAARAHRPSAMKYASLNLQKPSTGPTNEGFSTHPVSIHTWIRQGIPVPRFLPTTALSLVSDGVGPDALKRNTSVCCVSTLCASRSTPRDAFETVHVPQMMLGRTQISGRTCLFGVVLLQEALQSIPLDCAHLATSRLMAF